MHKKKLTKIWYNFTVIVNTIQLHALNSPWWQWSNWKLGWVENRKGSSWVYWNLWDWQACGWEYSVCPASMTNQNYQKCAIAVCILAKKFSSKLGIRLQRKSTSHQNQRTPQNLTWNLNHLGKASSPNFRIYSVVIPREVINSKIFVKKYLIYRWSTF